MRGGGSSFNVNMNRKSHAKSSTSCCSSVMLWSWSIIIVWVLFLIYCYSSGLLDQKQLSSEISLIVANVDNVINKTETSLLGGFSHIHFNSPSIHLPDAVDIVNSETNKILPIEDEVHVVFSTDCTPFQDWQTIVLFHSAKVVGQIGKVTRIASGCDEEKKQQLILLYKKLYPSGEYTAHFTPDFKKDEKTNQKYDFYNKPWGLKHWLDYSNPPIGENVVIALLDPDMIFVRPLTTTIRGLSGLIFNKHSIKEGEEVMEKISPGHAVAQMYGLGAPWANDNHKKFNRGKICGEGSPCLLPTERFGEMHYAVGPPYVLVKSDLHRLAKTWTTFVPRVYEGYPYLLAEMYAYSMAAAHENLPHLQLENYMVSNVDSGGEGWPLIDVLDDVCVPPGEDGIYLPGIPLPTVVHYCQGFTSGELGFYKRRVPKDIFTCKHPLLLEPPVNLAKEEYQIKMKDQKLTRKQKMNALTAKRNAYVLCVIHRSINSALIDYKKKMCGDDANFEKTMNINNL